MSTPGDSDRVELCGRLVVELGRERRESALPGRQGRILFAYLALNRDRSCGRDELIDLLWPRRPPADPEEVLSALLSKLRRALAPAALEGRGELTLTLPPGTSIDLETASEAAGRAERTLGRSEFSTAKKEAEAALEITLGVVGCSHDVEATEPRGADGGRRAPYQGQLTRPTFPARRHCLPRARLHAKRILRYGTANVAHSAGRPRGPFRNLVGRIGSPAYAQGPTEGPL